MHIACIQTENQLSSSNDTNVTADVQLYCIVR